MPRKLRKVPQFLKEIPLGNGSKGDYADEWGYAEFPSRYHSEDYHRAQNNPYANYLGWWRRNGRNVYYFGDNKRTYEYAAEWSKYDWYISAAELLNSKIDRYNQNVDIFLRLKSEDKFVQTPETVKKIQLPAPTEPQHTLGIQNWLSLKLAEYEAASKELYDEVYLYNTSKEKAENAKILKAKEEAERAKILAEAKAKEEAKRRKEASLVEERINLLEKAVDDLRGQKLHFDQFTITNMTEMDAIRRDLQELDAQNITRQQADENKLRKSEKKLNNEISTIRNVQLTQGRELRNQLKRLEDKIQQESFLGNVDITDLSKIRDLDSFNGKFVAVDYLVAAAREIPKLKLKLGLDVQEKYLRKEAFRQTDLLLGNFLTVMSKLTGKDFRAHERPYRGDDETDIDFMTARDRARELYKIPDKISDLVNEKKYWRENDPILLEWRKKVQSWVRDLQRVLKEKDFEDFFADVYPQDEDSSKDIKPEKTFVNSIVNAHRQLDELTSKLYQLEYDEDMARRNRELQLESFKKEVDEGLEQFGKHTTDEIEKLKAGLNKANAEGEKRYRQLYDVHSVRASRRSIGSRGKQANVAKPYDVAKTFLNNYLSIVFGRYV